MPMSLATTSRDDVVELGRVEGAEPHAVAGARRSAGQSRTLLGELAQREGAVEALVGVQVDADAAALGDGEQPAQVGAAGRRRGAVRRPRGRPRGRGPPRRRHRGCPDRRGRRARGRSSPASSSRTCSRACDPAQRRRRRAGCRRGSGRRSCRWRSMASACSRARGRRCPRPSSTRRRRATTAIAETEVAHRRVGSRPRRAPCRGGRAVRPARSAGRSRRGRAHAPAARTRTLRRPGGRRRPWSPAARRPPSSRRRGWPIAAARAGGGATRVTTRVGGSPSGEGARGRRMLMSSTSRRQRRG